MKVETIKGMKKQDILKLIEDAIDNINKINGAKDKINEDVEKIEEVKANIYSEDGLLFKIESANSEAAEKLNNIKEAYEEICEDGDEDDSISIKTQLEELISSFDKNKNEIEIFKKEVFGTKKEGENGVMEVVPGLFDKINDFHSKQTTKYNALYEKIETELLSGATTVNLASVFKEKVDGYKDSTKLWSILFIVVVSIFVIYYGIATIINPSAKNVNEVFLNLAFRSPFIAFGVWLAIFFGNRRAESKKLEESYTHKEVMARSYTGYKKSIEELDDEDSELLKIHMNNLLQAINQDSGIFLDSKGENYPLSDAVSESGKKTGTLINKVVNSLTKKD